MKYSEQQDKMNQLKAQISKLEDELYDSAKKYVMENQEIILNQWWEFDPDHEKPTRTFYQPTKIDQFDEHHEPEILGTFVEVYGYNVRAHQNVLANLILDGFLLGPSTRWEPVIPDKVYNCVTNSFQEAMDII